MREQCPACASRGKDRSRNNLILFRDGGKHCFACGYHEAAPFTRIFTQKEEPLDEEEKAAFPGDFTREIPADGWRWLLQYGLGKTYWEAYCGYSPSANRLIICHGDPVYVSQGRALTVGDTKWLTYGDRTNRVDDLGSPLSNEVVLVEDLISAHKVAQVSNAIPLLGTHVHENVLRKLVEKGKRVVLWLDQDQYGERKFAQTCSRIAVLTGLPTAFLSTPKDPKYYDSSTIKSLLASCTEAEGNQTSP